ncbi:MAG TPA: ABC transporter permease [Nitrososphaerales archaeon]|nr:ABC transporter permease [Nitrososphaerales archaeon]
MRPDRVVAFSRYEVRRAVARKKVLAVVALTVLLDTVPYYALAGAGLALIPAPFHPYLWAVGVFVPQAFFLQFIALLIAAGSMSEEYEQGTAEVLLSKPVGRDEYFLGKYLGGYSLLVIVIIMNSVLSVASATYVFGPQLGLGVLPLVLLVQAFSALVFFSLSFMIGELVRRSSLSYILSSAVFFTSQIVGIYLTIVYSLTGQETFRVASLYLPTSPVNSLPVLLAEPSFPSTVRILFRLGNTGAVETSILFSVLLVAVYSFSTLAIAAAYFARADVAKRIA